MHKRYIIHKTSVANKYWKNTKVNYKVKLNRSKSFNTITVVNGNRLYTHKAMIRFATKSNTICKGQYTRSNTKLYHRKWGCE